MYVLRTYTCIWMYYWVVESTLSFFLQWLSVAKENRFRRGHDGRECPVKITRRVSKFHLRIRLYSFSEKSETRTCYTFFNLHNVRGVTTTNDSRHHDLAFGVRFPSIGVSHMLLGPYHKKFIPGRLRIQLITWIVQFYTLLIINYMYSL